MNAKQKFISSKIKKVLNEGVRKNTHKPVSASNPRKPVDTARAAAIAYSEFRAQKTKK